MNMFGWGGGDIIALSRLVVEKYKAYKDAPDDYRHISDEVNSLQIIINKAVRHFESTTLSNNSRQEGQEILKGCQNVLEDLNSLIEKYDSLACANTGQVLQRIKLSSEDITTLRLRLISNTTLLNGFIQSCESREIHEGRAQILDFVRLFRTNSRVSLDSTSSSFAGSVNTRKGYKEFCKILYQAGITPDRINLKKREILNLFNAQTDDRAIQDPNQLPANRSRFSWVRPQIDFLVGPLMIAAATAGNTKRFIATSEYVQNPNFEDDRKETALHKAASGGYDEIVQLLLARGASVEAINGDNDTPLHLAAQNGHTSTAELLLGKGSLIEVTNEYNNTPLHLAAWSGHTSTVELLLREGASIGAINEHKDTPLHLAALGGYIDIVGILLGKGAPIEAQNDNGNAPIHLAAWYNRTSTLELLLGEGASIEAMGQHSNTALHLAIRAGNTGIVELLLAKGASTEAMDIYNNTPLDYVARKGQPDIVQLFKNIDTKAV